MAKIYLLWLYLLQKLDIILYTNIILNLVLVFKIVKEKVMKVRINLAVSQSSSRYANYALSDNKKQNSSQQYATNYLNKNSADSVNFTGRKGLAGLIIGGLMGLTALFASCDPLGIKNPPEPPVDTTVVPPPVNNPTYYDNLNPQLKEVVNLNFKNMGLAVPTVSKSTNYDLTDSLAMQMNIDNGPIYSYKFDPAISTPDTIRYWTLVKDPNTGILANLGRTDYYYDSGELRSKNYKTPNGYRNTEGMQLLGITKYVPDNVDPAYSDVLKLPNNQFSRKITAAIDAATQSGTVVWKYKTGDMEQFIVTALKRLK